MKDIKFSAILTIFLFSIIFVSRTYLQLDDPLTLAEYLLNIITLLYDG